MATKDASEQVGASSKGGVFLFLLGAAVASAAFYPDTALRTEVYGYEGPVAQAAAGAGLAFVGAGWVLWAITRPPPPRASIDANAAFKRRMSVPEGAGQIAKAAAGIAVPKPAPKRELSEAEKITLAIRDVNQRIGKAKVMLGTGRLSADGYTKYMGELHKELGDLEAKRMKIEFSHKGP